MNGSTGLDERPVEEALRKILEPLDRQLARAAMLVPLALVTVVPIVFFTLWLYHDWTGRRALITAGGACCALAALYMSWEIVAARVARWRFDRRFPPGTPARALALRILYEMETPSKAEEKLRVALASSSPDRIVRHRRGVESPSTVVAGPSTIATPGPEPSPPATVQVQPGSAAGADPGPRPGGYYDYIPLEPRSGDNPQGG